MFLLKEINELYDNFSKMVYKKNILDAKTKELIAVACSVMADCVSCIKYHYDKARQEGNSKEEIAEAFAITMSVSAGSKSAKYSGLIAGLE